MIESLLLCAVRLSTYANGQSLTGATGFFFERDGRLYVVTSRHVLIDEASGHFPDRVDVELHADADNVANSVNFTIPLYGQGHAVWRQGEDGGGEIDVAVLELDCSALTANIVYAAFTPAHLPRARDGIEVGASLLIVGFPLGFHDTLHHTPVARHAIIASSFGLRFQGEGYFLTDARTHRGSSGAPIVMRVGDDHALAGSLPWLLLGVHSARLDIGPRDASLDEALGLNCAWYADILMTLTEG